MAIRVLHIGDVHLGIDLYGRPDPAKGYGTRVGDFLARLDEALAFAAEADVVLFAGDLYKHPDPNPTLQREFGRRVLKTARDVPVVILPGNHDVPQAWERASSVEIFAALEVPGVTVARKAEAFALETRAGPLIVAPLPFVPRSRLAAQEEARGLDIQGVMDLLARKLHGIVREGLLPGVARLRAEHGERTPAVLLAHYIVGAPQFGGYRRGMWLTPEPALQVSQLADPALDYVALGHIHRHQCLTQEGEQPPVVYAGSIERIDFGEEKEEKVVVLAEVARGAAKWAPKPLGARRFVTLKVKVRDHEEPLAVLLAEIERRRDELPDAVVRVSYTLGAGRPPAREAEVRAALKEAAFIAGIRRELPPQEATAKHPGLSTELGPVEALEEYLRLHPELESQREALLTAARELVTQVARAEAAA